jgi:hypothetical protein
MNIKELFAEVHYTLALHSICTTYENTIVNLTNAIDETVADPNIETIDVTRVLALQWMITVLQNKIEIVHFELEALKPILVSQNYFAVLANAEWATRQVFMPLKHTTHRKSSNNTWQRSDTSKAK